MKKNAFTLVELIITIAISAVVLSTISTFFLNVRTTGVRIESQAEVLHNAQRMLNLLKDEIRSADSLISTGSTPSIFDTHPGRITLANAGVETILDTVERQVMLGGQPINVRSLRRKVGAETAVELTSNKVTISNFVVRNRTRGSGRNIVSIELTVQDSNPGNDSNRQSQISLKTSIALRQSQ